MPPAKMVTEVCYWPDGCDPNGVDAFAFMVKVTWRGAGRYSVESRGRTLSRAGKWAWSPQPFQRHQYRFDSLEHACEWAERVVDDVDVAGRTWREWETQP
jgi:hypothetical protein